jgi:hypothetical protein
MRALLVIALSAVVGGTIALWTIDEFPSLTQQTNTDEAAKAESPFACDFMALTPEIRKRHFEVLGPALRSMRTSVRELPNGYEFEFTNDEKTYQLLTEWVFQESQCCPFFDLEVRLKPEHGGLVMRVTGRRGTKAFIQADAAKWVQPVN